MIHARLFPRCRQGLDRDRFGPSLQILIQRKRQLVPPRSLTMVDHGRLSILGEEASATEHSVARRSRGESCRVPLPVHHVLAGDMGKGEAFLVVVDVVQMVPISVVERGIGISRERTAGPGVGQVIGQPGLRRVRRHGRRFELSGDVIHSHCVHKVPFLDVGSQRKWD